MKTLMKQYFFAIDNLRVILTFGSLHFFQYESNVL